MRISFGCLICRFVGSFFYNFLKGREVTLYALIDQHWDKSEKNIKDRQEKECFASNKRNLIPTQKTQRVEVETFRFKRKSFFQTIIITSFDMFKYRHSYFVCHIFIS